MAPSSDALCEIRSALTLRSAFGAGKKRAEHSFEATTPIQLPEAGRAIPPATKPTPATFATTDAPTRARGWLAAVFLGAAFPPSPPVADGLTAPVAWHAHQPRLATVDGSGRVLVHADPAGIDGRGAVVSSRLGQPRQVHGQELREEARRAGGGEVRGRERAAAAGDGDQEHRAAAVAVAVAASTPRRRRRPPVLSARVPLRGAPSSRLPHREPAARVRREQVPAARRPQ